MAKTKKKKHHTAASNNVAAVAIAEEGFAKAVVDRAQACTDNSNVGNTIRSSNTLGNKEDSGKEIAAKQTSNEVACTYSNLSKGGAAGTKNIL